MRKINTVLYNKLLLQAEEAKEQGLVKLAKAITDSIDYTENKKEYSYKQLKEDVHNDIWKLATNILSYYDIESIDSVKLDNILTSYAQRIINEVEDSLGLENVIGPNEPKLPGERE